MIKPAFVLKYLVLSAAFFALTVSNAHAQEFGGNPPSIKWKQVNTPAARVIFPAGLDSAGLRVAQIIQRMNKAIQPTIGFKQKQVNILLQNQTTISNAYVGLAPFRSEFYLTPDQNSFAIGSLYWPDQLAIHEFRHVQQYNNFNVGLSKGLSIIFGEGGQAVGNELSIPDWFFEGDAVFNETLVSQQGRGRLPYFFNGFRTLWSENKDYNWQKLRNGSYRDYVPDWYPLGYMLVSYGRQKYGDEFWKKVTHDAAAFDGLIYPFQKSVRRYSGISFTQFRADALGAYKKEFASTDQQLNVAKASATKHFDADREYPAFIDDHTLIYMKSSYDHRPLFVINRDGVEQRLSVRSLSLDNYFAYHDGKVVYASYRPDLRWNYRDYSELIILDVNSGEEHRLTKGTKYFSPDFSADGKTIVAVNEGINVKSELHLLNAGNGELISILPNKANLFYTYPKFFGTDQLISAVRTPQGEMTLALIDIKTGENKFLLPLSYQPIGFLNVKKDTVYFSVTTGKDDQLYALNVSTDKLYRAANIAGNGTIGAYQPASGDGKFAWVGLTAEGFHVNEKDKKEVQWVPETGICCGLFNSVYTPKDSTSNLLATVTEAPLPVTKYSKGFHLFNFHSIEPAFSDPNYSLSLLGENVLNTFQSALTFTYNSDEGYKELGFSGTYGALFPYLSGGFDYVFDRRGYYKGDNVYWNETELHAGIQVPLKFTEGRHLTGLTFGTDVVYNSTNFQAPYRSTFNDRSYTYLNHYISFSNSLSQAKKNIYPTLAQTISFNYRYAVTNLSASQFLTNGALYFPGFFTNHSIVLTGAFQQNERNSVITFSNGFPFSRGYQAENLYQLEKGGVNYHFPIAYPDKGIANAIYFLRIRGNFFYDYTHANDYYSNGSPFKANFRTIGSEVFFDTQWFNQVPITFGIRYSHLQDPDLFGYSGRNRIELVVPVSIF